MFFSPDPLTIFAIYYTKSIQHEYDMRLFSDVVLTFAPSHPIPQRFTCRPHQPSLVPLPLPRATEIPSVARTTCGLSEPRPATACIWALNHQGLPMVNSLPALTMPKWGLWTGMIQVDPSNDPKWIQVVGAPLGCFGWIPRRQWNPTASGFPSGLPWSARPAGLLQLCGSQTRLPFEILVFTAPPPPRGRRCHRFDVGWPGRWRRCSHAASPSIVGDAGCLLIKGSPRHGFGMVWDVWG